MSIKKRLYILPSNLALPLIKLFILCLSLSKLSQNWIWNTAHSDKFWKKKFDNLIVLVHVLQTTQNSFQIISLCCFAENEMYQELYILDILLSDVPVAVWPTWSLKIPIDVLWGTWIKTYLFTALYRHFYWHQIEIVSKYSFCIHYF